MASCDYMLLGYNNQSRCSAPAKKNQDALLNVYYVRSKRIPSAELLRAGRCPAPENKKIMMPCRRAELNIYYYSIWSKKIPSAEPLRAGMIFSDFPWTMLTVWQPRSTRSTWPLGPKLGYRDARNPFIFLKSDRAPSQTTIPSPLSHCVPLCALSVRSWEI